MISTQEIAQFTAELRRRGLSGSTVNGALATCGRVLDYAVRHGYLASNPVRRLERAERPRIDGREARLLDRSEIDRLLQAAEGPYRTAIGTAIFTGLRVGELTGLKWADIDLAAGAITSAGRRCAAATPPNSRPETCPVASPCERRGRDLRPDKREPGTAQLRPLP